MKITYCHSPIVQAADYYPFGMTFNSYQRTNSAEQRWKFQGQEHVDDLDLGWVSFTWRNHDPAIGRFFNVDPLTEKFYYNSPYAFSENKVTSHIELEGLEAWDIKNEWNEENIAKYNAYVNEKANALSEAGVKCTCEDFALTTLVDFASENNLPLIITNGSGTFDANSADFNSFDDFKLAVLNTTGARDLQNNLNTVQMAVGPGSIQDANAGDILLMRNSNDVATHVQVVVASDNQFVKIRHGNSGALNSVPGSSRILGASNTNSPFYTDTEIQTGYYSRQEGFYIKNGAITPNALDNFNLERRQWNFSVFNIRHSVRSSK